jgi:16S rRNA A1518/A1519 N6-dimethyltransferase RsmA/KsgA/DIM1 with predicted DNA glycosylase/AP lyase activity
MFAWAKSLFIFLFFFLVYTEIQFRTLLQTPKKLLYVIYQNGVAETQCAQPRKKEKNHLVLKIYIFLNNNIIQIYFTEF